MAESFSVKAILSAQDKGFSSAMKAASQSVSNLKSTITGGLGFGVLAGIGQSAFNAITSGVSGLVSELNSSSAAWKTFQGNMEMNGHTADEIASIKSELQDFATQTIYSASDMASTFAQLDAVGTKNTKDLVKGFGGLAAAAENPAQAMKTLSQQATQAAAKPYIQWADFRLMLEQTPAGMSAVAKEMGMSMDEMVLAVQDGTVATEDFFDAIAKVGTNEAFTKMATEYKTVGQAMDGLTETVSNKLAPAFDVLSSRGISAISGIVDAIGELDGEAVAGKLTSFLDKASGYWNVLKTNALEVGSAFEDAFSAIGKNLSDLTGAFGSTESIKSFSDVITAAKDALVGFAGFLEDNADAIAKLITNLPKLWLAFQGFKVLKTAAPLVSAFAGGIKKLGSAALSKIAPNLFGIAKGQDEVGKSSKRTSKQTLNSAKAFMMMGAGVLLVSSSMFVLAQAAIQLADSGGTAIGVFAGMTAAVTALSLGMAYMLANIKSTPKQIETMGNSFLKMSAGVSLVVASLSALALALVPLGELGSTAVPALAAFGAVVGGLAAVFGTFGQKLQSSMTGIIAFSGSVSVLALAMTPLASTGTEGAIAMAAFGVVVAGLVAIFATFGTALNAAIPAMLAFGATILMVGEGMNLASSFIDALVPLIQQLGDTFQTVGETIGDVAESIGEAIKTVGEGIATVVDSITGGLSNILQSIADIISSIGQSAKDAGTGFKSVAEGISMIAALSLIDIVKSLGSVATGISTISKKGKDLPEVAAGMQQLMSALVMASAAITVFVAGMQQISTISTVASTSLAAVQAAFNGFAIVPPDVSPMTAAFASITAAALAMVPQLNNAGQQAGQGLAKGLESGSRSAEKATTTAVRSITSETQKLVPQMANSGKQAANGFSVALQSGYARALSLSRSAVSSILSALRSAQSGAYSAGYNIGAGLANGMSASLGRVQSIAAQLAAAAEKAIRAEAQIHSPSRVTDKLGQYFGEGWVQGILSMAKDAKQATEELIAIPSLPDVPTPSLAGSGGGNWELSEDYSYTRNTKYTIVVPVNLEGKEVSRITAPFMEGDLKKREKVNNMINGIR